MKKTLAFDIGGSFIKYALIDEKYNIISQSSVKTPDNYSDFIYMIKDITFGYKGEIIGLCIAIPGGYNFLTDEVFAPNLQLLNGKRIKKDLETLFNLKVVIENDANLATLGEYTLYEKGKIKNMIFVTLGTGVGGGLIIDGKLLESPITSFEIGHMSLDPNGRLCGCGRKGCFDEYCSSIGLSEIYKELSGKNINIIPQELGNLSEKGDKTAVSTFKKYAKYLSFGLLNIANIFYAEKVKLGGGLSELSNYYIDDCRELFERSLFPMYKGTISLEVASLKNNAGIIGAGIYFFEKN